MCLTGNINTLLTDHITWKRCLLLTCLLVGTMVTTGWSATWYVDDDASDAGDGQSWATAYQNIQDAVDAAEADGGGEVWVAGGIYDQGVGSVPGVTIGQGSNVVIMAEGVDLYGGFSGNEVNRASRDWQLNETIIDGRRMLRGVYGADNARLDGFIINNCKVFNGYGGGMFNYSESPTVENCFFVGNISESVGGAVYNGQGCSSIFTNCVFDENWANYWGGAVANDENSLITIKQCQFLDNHADERGGGVYNKEASPDIINCLFHENTAGLFGGAIFNAGAKFNTDASFPQVMNCTFVENRAGTTGGGIFNHRFSAPVVTNCIFWGNGTEILHEDAAPTVTFSCVEGGYTGEGNINTDPGFLDSENGDFRISMYSPCVDAGTANNAPDIDLQGNPRPFRGAFDMGAYESYSKIYHVDAAGNDGDGLTWDQAKVSIQEAVDAAFADGGGEVWVAAGTYYITEKPDEPLELDQVVLLREHVSLYGGFAGDELTRDQRNWINNVTTLDASSVLNMVGVRGVVGANNTVLDGFTITNGYIIDGNGAGMYNENASPVVRNCIFTNNSAQSEGDNGNGGGLCNLNCSPIIENCTFSNNSAVGRGGGMNNVNSPAMITDCVFTENRVYFGFGGGMFNEGDTKVVNCTFTNNIADYCGGGMYNGVGSQEISHCTFTGNESSKSYADFMGGGGMYNLRSSAVITDCLFQGNSAQSETLQGKGDGMYNENSSLVISECVFSENDGTGLYNKTSSFEISDCTFNANATDGICNNDSSPMVSACVFTGNLKRGMMNEEGASPVVVNSLFTRNLISGIGNTDSSPTVVNCSIAGNMTDGAGSGMNNNNSEPVIRNCILWNNGSSIINRNQSHCDVTYSCIQGGYSGEGNIDQDPMFVDEANGNLRIRLDSPCVDAGTESGAPDKDFTGVPRPQLSGYDMGAFESVRFYVDDDAPAGGDGYSWATAFNSIQDAVDGVALYGGGGIWIAEGTYTGTGQYAVEMVDGVTLYGGFAGDETALDQRNPENNLSVIDGENQRGCVKGAVNIAFDGVTISNGSTSAYDQDLYVASGISCLNSSSLLINCSFVGNSGPVVLNAASDVTIKSCQFTGNYYTMIKNMEASSLLIENCKFLENPSPSMGLIENIDSSAMIRNCLFEELGRHSFNNSAAIYNSSSLATVIDCTFTLESIEGIINLESDLVVIKNCDFTLFYGATCILNNLSNVTIENCIFSPSEIGFASSGIYNNASSPTIKNCHFSLFRANEFGGGVVNVNESAPTIMDCHFSENLIGVNNSHSSSPTITKCEFTKNIFGIYSVEASPTIINSSFSNNTGGGYTGIVHNEDCPGTRIEGCTFSENGSDNSNTIINNISCSPLISDCVFQNNNSSPVYNHGNSSPTVKNCLFVDNHGGSCGGVGNNGMNVTSLIVNCVFVNNEGGSCGAIYNDQSSPSIMNCTIVGNQHDSQSEGAGGIYNDYGATPIITNTILWGNSGEVGNSRTSNATVTYSCIQGGSPGEGNIYADPRFWNAEQGNLRLLSMSPCIDVGIGTDAPETDIRGLPRPYGAGVDMGAYEWSNLSPDIVAALLGLASASATMDTNSDGLLDAADLRWH